MRLVRYIEHPLLEGMECKTCGGLGEIKDRKCRACDGDGLDHYKIQLVSDYYAITHSGEVISFRTGNVKQMKCSMNGKHKLFAHRETDGSHFYILVYSCVANLFLPHRKGKNLYQREYKRIIFLIYCLDTF